MKEADIKSLEALPLSTTCRRIDFTTATVVPGFINNTFFLIVTGEKPWVTMKVELQPLIYIVQPDYWGIEVVGCQSGIGLPQTAPYSAVLDISHTRGKLGIEVIGAHGNKKIKV